MKEEFDALFAEYQKLLGELQAMSAVKTAQQEPVLWMMPDGKTVDKWGLQFYGGLVGKPLYTTPPAQRKPLTDEEIWKFWCSRPEVPEGEDDSMEAEFVAAVRAVLAAHGIKENT